MPGIVLGQVVMGVLGVLLLTGEYSSGVIRGTLAAVLAAAHGAGGQGHGVRPRRPGGGGGRHFRSFPAGVAALPSSVPHPALSQPSVLRAVLMSGGRRAVRAAGDQG